MKLKLLAPFVVDGLDLDASRILQDPGGYARAWDRVAAAWFQRHEGGDPSPWAAEDADLVRHLRFCHSSPYAKLRGSRYRSLEHHSLPRPLHAVELVLAPSGSVFAGWLRDAMVAYRASISPASTSTAGSEIAAGGERMLESLAAWLEAGPAPVVVLRLHPHRVGLLEVDLDLDSVLDVQGDALPERLELHQQAGIALAEHLAGHLHRCLIEPLVEWLHAGSLAEAGFLERVVDDAVSAPSGTRALWVTRSLILESGDGERFGVGDAELRRFLAGLWLEGLSAKQRRATIEASRTDDDFVSTAWLTYFFAAGSYEGDYPRHGFHGIEATPVREGEDREGGDREREPGGEELQSGDGRSADGRTGGTAFRGAPAVRAGSFSDRWEAMLIAQYYYAAFDQLQSRVSRLLASAVSPGEHQGLAGVQATLDTAVDAATMLNIEFEENAKLYSRRVAPEVQAILDHWSFEDGVRKRLGERTEQCVERLGELHARASERNAVYTDLLLLGLGVTAIFEIVLYLSEYGRSLAADPELSVYERFSVVDLAEWFGARSTDAVLLVGAVVSLGLVALYGFFRIKQSRM